MTTFDNLPNEVIDEILMKGDVSLEDLIRFTVTCKRMSEYMDGNNRLWRYKFFQRWPYLREISETLVGEKPNYKELTMINLKCRISVAQYVRRMSQIHFYHDDLTSQHVKDFNVSFNLNGNARNMNYYFIIDKLMQIIHQPLSQCRLTERYYASKLIAHMKCNHQKTVLCNFLNKSCEKQLPEMVATIIAAWCQPDEHIGYPRLSAMLEKIKKTVLQNIRREYPQHPVLSTSAEKFVHWRDNNIYNNQFKNDETEQILMVLCKVLFEQFYFTVVKGDIFRTNHVYINHVLENRCGTDVTIAIIFQSVARRLGVYSEMSLSTPNILSTELKNVHVPCIVTRYLIIDLCNKVIRRVIKYREVRYLECPLMRCSNPHNVTSVELALASIDNIKSALLRRHGVNTLSYEARLMLELRHVINPGDIAVILELGLYYKSRNMRLDDVVAMLREAEQVQQNVLLPLSIDQLISHYENYQNSQVNDNITKVRVKHRDPSLKYKIGMLVQYSQGDFCFSSVIIGWDIKYEPQGYNSRAITLIEDYWSYDIMYGPFYKVLSDDGALYYVPQDTLTLSAAIPIFQYEVGRYFSKFVGTHYTPNESMKTLYPDDSIRT